MTTPNPREHLLTLLKSFDTAMLATRTEAGTMRARPMALAEVRDTGLVHLAAGLDDPKVADIEADPNVGLFMQSKTQWVSVSGRARVVRDRELIHRLWSEVWRVWNPGGKDDPNLCLIAVDPVEGEYWDNAGVRGVRFLVDATKAYLTGTTPENESDANARVSLTGSPG